MKAILLDLDDTLLSNNIRTFLPAYFESLARFLKEKIPSERLIRELLRGTAFMDADSASDLTNEEAFESVFYASSGLIKEEIRPLFARFYSEEFPKLRVYTRPIFGARKLVELAFSRGWQVVVATNPVFPRTAVELRLDWAGVPVQDFAYTLITSLENMHATKASSAYYREILAKMAIAPGECLMVGDDWSMDMVPAAEEGIPGYWITESSGAALLSDERRAQPVSEELRFGEGTLWALYERLSSAV